MITEKAIEKLFNTLGREMAMRYYGLDLHFTVLKVEHINSVEYDIEIKTDQPIPVIFDVKIEPNFIYGKYAPISDLLGNLSSLLKYVGVKYAHITLPEQTYPESWTRDGDTMDYIEHPQNFIELESVGSVLEIDTGYVYPLFNDGKIDTLNGNSIANIDDEEWWESLNGDDKRKLNDIYG